jgi:DNA-binding GntR family transcriptional regulator
MPMTIVSAVVLAALRVHPARKVSRCELCALSGCSDRAIRAAISELRRAGWLIVGDESGYWFARSVEEVNQVIMNLERQERSLHEIIEAMRGAAMFWFGEFPCLPTPTRPGEYQ